MLNKRLFGQLVLGAWLTVTWNGQAAAQYALGNGLDVIQINRPGEGAVNSYIFAGTDSIAILVGQRIGAEASQVVALARSPGYPAVAPAPDLIGINAYAVAIEQRG